MRRVRSAPTSAAPHRRGVEPPRRAATSRSTATPRWRSIAAIASMSSMSGTLRSSSGLVGEQRGGHHRQGGVLAPRDRHGALRGVAGRRCAGGPSAA